MTPSEIVKLPYIVLDDHLNKFNSDELRVMFKSEGKVYSRDFTRETLLKNGFTWTSGAKYKDARSFNGGRREGSGAKEKPEDETYQPITVYPKKKLVKLFGGKDKIKEAINYFLNNHFEL